MFLKFPVSFFVFTKKPKENFSLQKVFKLILFLITMVSGKVVQFRRGRHLIKEKHMLIEIENVLSKEEAEKMIGKDVEWKSPAGKIIKGKVSGAHGNRGVVRVIFEKGLPGQSVGTNVEVK